MANKSLVGITQSNIRDTPVLLNAKGEVVAAFYGDTDVLLYDIAFKAIAKEAEERS